MPNARSSSVLKASLFTGDHANIQARLEERPPYSPDFKPIENLWSKVKPGLKSRAPRIARQRLKPAGTACNIVTPEDCRSFLLQTGYALIDFMRLQKAYRKN